ncbi:hypothetical protein BC832DRAFT_270950 [Gaertneriomyces semiglobifer]|nr:hypothetical protein BC832DRAFT_270950 [Gaertneriomyces semiglobifer]
MCVCVYVVCAAPCPVASQLVIRCCGERKEGKEDLLLPEWGFFRFRSTLQKSSVRYPSAHAHAHHSDVFQFSAVVMLLSLPVGCSALFRMNLKWLSNSLQNSPPAMPMPRPVLLRVACCMQLHGQPCAGWKAIYI